MGIASGTTQPSLPGVYVLHPSVSCGYSYRSTGLSFLRMSYQPFSLLLWSFFLVLRIISSSLKLYPLMRISDVFKHRTIVWYSCLVIVISMWRRGDSNTQSRTKSFCATSKVNYSLYLTYRTFYHVHLSKVKSTPLRISMFARQSSQTSRLG